MDGILCVDKPAGFTSFDVIGKLRPILRERRMGHAGTLDPMATGVLPVFVGRATKLCDLLPNQDKRYIARFQLGLETDTYDITGSVTKTADYSVVTRERVAAVLRTFVGAQMQLPPMYSAVKVGGAKLYDLARKGMGVRRAPRPVEIYSLALTDADPVAGWYEIDVCCSKGTYIRSLCFDLGRSLGCGATLVKLRRTQAGAVSIAQCIPLEEIVSRVRSGKTEQMLLPMDQLLLDLPALKLDQKQQTLFLNGVRLDLRRISAATQGVCRVYGPSGALLGIADQDTQTNELRLLKMLSLGESD